MAVRTLANPRDDAFAEQQVGVPPIEPRDRGWHEIQIRATGLGRPNRSGFIERQRNPSDRGIAVAETNRAI